MRSRWFHRPTLHAPLEHEGKRVSWLELFYDLIFVAAIIQLGDYLSGDVSTMGFLKFAGHFAPLWVAWTGFTFYANRFNVDDFLHRSMVLLQMFAVGTMAIYSHASMSGHSRGFALSFAAALGLLSLMLLRAWMHEPTSRAYSRYWGLVFGGAAAAFTISAFVPGPWTYALWALGIGGVLYGPISHQSRALSEQFPLDMEHLSERYGLLTIIVLGESFVKVLSYLTGQGDAAMNELGMGIFNLTLTCCVWWIYFDDIAGSKLKSGRGAWIVWLYGHLPLTLAITAMGVAVKKAVSFDVHEVAYGSYRWLLAGSLALTLLSVAIIDSVTERRNAELSDRHRVNVRTFSAVVVLLMGQVGGAATAGTFLTLIAAVCVAQVLFDMMMAPWEESAEMDEAVSAADLARARAAGADAPPANRRPDVSKSVRKGAPAELRRDLFFFFMEGSWTRLMLSFVFAFVILNATFAALFMLEPGSISGSGEDAFAEAFAFSVQTFATIGYGALSPASAWANLVVTIEAVVGVLFVALATGLMLAKASRPQSSVLWSRRVVITRRNGRPVMMLRVANARGNDVVDATMSVSALMDEVSPEGHHMRRVLDLKLVRDRQPMFVLSFTAVHEIDESSPLCGLDWSRFSDGIGGLVVTLMGHDGTYGQTTYARHIYYPDDIMVGHRFVDVMSQLPDGRLMIDFELFHDTEADGSF